MPVRVTGSPGDRSLEMDPEWKPVQEIVRLNFKALHDVVKAHGEAIMSLEKGASNKVNRVELTQALTEKANLGELSGTFQELSRLIDDKVERHDMNAGLERKAGRSEVEAALTAKADVGEVQRCLDEKAGVDELQEHISALEARNEALENRLAELDREKADDARIATALEGKVDAEEVREIVASAVSELAATLRSEIAAAVEPKSSKASVAAALKAKVNRTEVEALLASHADQIREALGTKAEVEAVSTALAAKASRAEMTEQVESKADELKEKLSEKLSRFASTDALAACEQDMHTSVESMQARLAKVDEAYQSSSRSLRQDLEAHAGEVKLALAGKASAADLASRVRSNEVEVMLASKPDRADVDSAQASLATRLAADLTRQAGELKSLLEDRVAQTRAEMHTLTATVERKADRPEVEAALAQRPALSEVEMWMSTKAGVDELHSQVELAKQEARAALDGRASVPELRGAFDTLDGRIGAAAEAWRAELAGLLSDKVDNGHVEAVLQQLVSKASIEDALLRMEKKANVDDINRSLMEVNRELAQRPTLVELNRVIGEQSLIMESLCSEHLLGRWIWKSGRTKGDKHAVPWNVQNINTNPENFVWEKDRCAITTTAPGLYEVTFGFFTRKKPSVQLLVNGEPVLSAINSASYAVHHSSGRLAAVGPHPAGNVTGLTLIDYLALPPQARVSCSYQGEDGGEGFLGLRKM